MRTTLTVFSLMVVLCAACQGAPPMLPPMVVPDCLGVNIHFSGREDAQVEKIAAAGFRYIRMDFVWGSIEAKKGEYDFKRYDDLVDSLAARGIRPLFILDYGNGHYEQGKPPVTDEGRAAFAAFAGAGAAHFRGKGVVWEVWNEPNGEWFWKNPNAEDYVELVKAASVAIKKADPDCAVIGPATCGRAYFYIEKAIKAGLLDYVDALSLHPYGCKPPEEAITFYSRLRWMMAKYVPKGRPVPPLVCSEWGYPSLPSSSFGDGVTVEQQADYLARVFLVNTMSGCRISIWYDWRNDGTGTSPGDREHNFGTVYNDFREKPAYAAMKTLTSELDGYAFVRRVSLDSRDDYALLFRKGNDYRLAAWTTAEPHAISVPVDAPSVEVVSVTGERSRMGVDDETLKLDLSGSVRYVEPSAPCRRWALDTAWKAR